MGTSTLQDLYVDELRDLLGAENQILKAFPKMAESASSPELQKAFEEHLEQTREHRNRINQILEGMGEEVRSKKCKGMEGIIEEGKDLIERADGDEVLDAGLIAAAQRVEHYEIAAYGTLRTYAEHLGEEEAAELLQMTLDEEAETDEKLTELAQNGINADATGT